MLIYRKRQQIYGYKEHYKIYAGTGGTEEICVI